MIPQEIFIASLPNLHYWLQSSCLIFPDLWRPPAKHRPENAVANCLKFSLLTLPLIAFCMQEQEICRNNDFASSHLPDYKTNVSMQMHQVRKARTVGKKIHVIH